MLRISEHVEFYSNDHFSLFEKVVNWRTYFDKSVSADYIPVDTDQNYVSISLQRGEGDNYICRCNSSYYIGLDRFPMLGLNVYVEPKLNTEKHTVNYIGILMESLQEPENFEHLEGLLTTKFNEEWLEIDSALQPLLTPFLIAQFLSLVKEIVKKGLKKSYYTKTENLKSRVKGKVLIGEQIKQNILKNKFTNTVCRYQEFGFDTQVNQFLKFVLNKIQNHLDVYAKDSEWNKNLFELLNYSKGGFQQVSNVSFNQFVLYESNPFYKNYNQAVLIGNQILNMSDYNVSKNSKNCKIKHPPFWIDMSKLFELYVFKKLKQKFPLEGEVKYHEKYNRQEPDFILNTKSGIKTVVDAKYKPRYSRGNPSMKDARQLAGYTRLNSIYKELKLTTDCIIPAYFIYPSELIDGKTEENNDNWAELNTDSVLDSSVRESSTYNKMYMQEIQLLKN